MVKFLIFSICCLFINAHADNKIVSSIKTRVDIKVEAFTWKKVKYFDNNYGIFLRNANMKIKFEYNKNIHSLINFCFSPKKIEYFLRDIQIYYIKKKNKFTVGLITPFCNLEDNTPINKRLLMGKCAVQGLKRNNFYGMMLNLNTRFGSFYYYLLKNNITKTNHKFSLFSRFFMYKKYKNKLIHIGLNYKAVQIHNSKKPKYIGDTPFFPQAYSHLRTPISNLLAYTSTGLELIWIFKKLSIQAEISLINAKWKIFNPQVYKYGYIDFSYFLTSEKHGYNPRNGYLEKPKLSKNMAIELTLKYGFNDFRGIHQEQNITDRKNAEKHFIIIGFNAYKNDNTTYQINYAIEDYHDIELKRNHSIGIGIILSF